MYLVGHQNYVDNNFIINIYNNIMVVFFTSSNPKFVIYMGIDKFENELLIKWALPIDIW